MSEVATANTQFTPADQAAIAEAMQDIGVAVATGLVPFLGQAINIYDTVECLLRLHNSTQPTEEMEAKFDLVLALVGWVPGAGAGVKKTIRIVNKHPDRYVPILFDVLRLITDKIGIKTSPEALLDKLFDASGLKAYLGTVQSSIESSWVYEELPQQGQMAISSGMTLVRAELPAMVMLVTVKLVHWKKQQRNNASQLIGTRAKTSPTDIKPAKKADVVAKTGKNAPMPSQSHATTNAQIGVAAIEEIGKSLTGIVGEHITDYFLYEHYGWGKDWSAHDQGTQGLWKQRPDKTFPGKLNENTKLNQLFAPKAHGTGIDGVWKVQLGDPHNGGKPYAIVESKASVVKKAPKNPSSKPGVSSKLGDNARRIKDAVLPKPEELLEPDTAQGDAVNSVQKTGGGRAGKPGRNANQPSKKSSSGASAKSKSFSQPEPLVQMSKKWIAKNIRAAISDQSIIYDIREHGNKVYSRHLFYPPFYLPTAILHEKALLNGAPGKHDLHTNHDIPSTHRHDEQEVKAAVNQKLKKLNLDIEL
ncbi:MAG: hypothetical protein KGM99_17070 [Burkholderiales bacterium]|nr:hypothetical protein [Burkholderiales bacterium]